LRVTRRRADVERILSLQCAPVNTAVVFKRNPKSKLVPVLAKHLKRQQARIDSDGEAKLAALENSDRVLKPTAIISTSPNKYQVFWRVEGFDFESQERALKLLAFAFGGDPACTDCNRVLRVPGFST
jgi:RepB DNA-primase from phage plasmid